MEQNELQKELEKEIEFNMEKERLRDVLNIISQEILVNISKRKEMAEYIKNYRKKVIEEYRDDEDKVAEYFDHERFVKEEAFKSIDRKLKELTILENSPYFGKIYFNDKELNEESTIYIGRFGLTPEGEYEPVIVDWRAPASALFYAGKLGEAYYRAPIGNVEVDILSKRQFVIKKGSLIGMFDSELDVKDEVLQMVLSHNTSDKLKDIIMTIQAEQDNIIRQPREKSVLVNGIAGSGKTTIALHRVAYLLYNFRDVLQDKVLIIGPNNIFMEYISTVLPSLGEVGVRQSTFTEFACKLLDVYDVMRFKDYMEKVLAGDNDFIETIKRKNSTEYIIEMNSFVEKLNKEYYKTKDVVFFNTVVINSDEINKMFNEYFVELPLFRRSKKIKRIIFSKIKDVRDDRVRYIQREYKKKLQSLSPEELQLEANQLDFKRRMQIREVIQEVMRVKDELKWLNNPSVVELYREHFVNAPLINDDLAPMLYLKIKLEGFKVKEEIKHIVIDEAQDYSEFQFIVLKELTKCQSMTIVGDINQRIIPVEGIVPMLNVEKILGSERFEKFDLNKSYRSTKEIMEYAGKYLAEDKIMPLVRSGAEVTEEKFQDEDTMIARIVEDTKRLTSKGYESIAIICKTLEETEIIGRKLKDSEYVKVMNREDIIYNGGVVAIPSYFAKGMEFDAVILVSGGKHEHMNIIDYDKLMYVMSTRALHELYVYKYKIS